MHRILITLTLFPILALTACAPSHDYLGDRFPPTEAVTIYYPHQPVPEGYVVIGTNRTEAAEDTPAEEMVEHIAAKAREVGAHAIAVEDFTIQFAGVTEHTDIDHDRHGYTERTRVSDRRVKVINATFLRRPNE